MKKIEMSRVIVMALYNMKTLPAETNQEVVRQMKQPKLVVEDRYQLAIAALKSIGREVA